MVIKIYQKKWSDRLSYEHSFGNHKVCINKNNEISLGRSNSKSRYSMQLLLEYLKNKYPEDAKLIDCIIELAREM